MLSLEFRRKSKVWLRLSEFFGEYFRELLIVFSLGMASKRLLIYSQKAGKRRPIK
jgi:hypothetical protein